MTNTENINLLLATHKQLYKNKSGVWASGAFPLEVNALADRIPKVSILANVKNVDQVSSDLILIDSNVRIYSIFDQYQRFPYNIRFIPYFWTIFRTIRTCLDSKCNIVLAKVPGEEGLGAVVGASIIRVPIILRPVGNPLYSELFKKRFITRIWVRSLSSLAIFLSTVIAPVSPHLSVLYKSYSRTNKSIRFYSIPDPILGDEFFLHPAKKTPRKTKQILFLGRLDKNKNVSLLLNALQMIVNQGLINTEELNLLVVGSGSEENELKRMTIDLGIQPFVKFLPWVSQNKVPNLIQESYMVVLPSFSEGFGNVLVQAMAGGKPVIAANRDGPLYIVKNNINGFLIDPLDVSEWANKMALLISNPQLAIRMGEESLRIAKCEYYKDVVLAKWLSLLGEVLN